MAWGKPLAEELAAAEAAQVAQERAATRALMSPWQQQMLAALVDVAAVLGEIRDTLTRQPLGGRPGSVSPQPDPGQLAGVHTPAAVFTGEPPTT